MTELHIATYTPTQASCLINLWHACFPTDSPSYIARFMQVLPSDTIFVVGEIDNQPLTMACLIPAQASFGNEQYAVRYLYAGCTHPQVRGKGYYRQLMNAACQLTQQAGEHAIYLHPANDKLEYSYRRMGYLPGIVGGGAGKQLRQPANDVLYQTARHTIIRQLRHTTVVWDIAPNVANFFLRDAIENRAEMVCSDTEVSLWHKKTCIESFSLDHTNNNNTAYCLWIPTSISTLHDIMLQHGGCTGLVGD